MKYYVVADPHGYYTYLMEALKEKGYFEDKEPHKLIICGDIFDRGEEAKEMEKFVLDLIKKDQVILIRGNHEDLVLDYIIKFYDYVKWGLKTSHHYSNGTVDTFCQLTGMSIYDVELFPTKALDLITKTDYVAKILTKMVNYYETGHYIFVHGWIPCNTSGYGGRATNFKYDENWRTSTIEDWCYARWYNGMLAASQGVIEPNKTIVCGHWHCSYGHARLEGKGTEFGPTADFTPYKAKGIIALDGCTFESHKVNCIVIND